MTKNRKFNKVAFLYGGVSSEREVSLLSAKRIEQSLIDLGYQVKSIDFNFDTICQLKRTDIDVVFNGLYGKYCEDGRLQGALDLIQIPYTHSGAAASAVAMNKVIAHNLVKPFEILTPKFSLLFKGEKQKNQETIKQFGKNYVIKPINEGSSVGVQIFLDNNFNIDQFQWNYGDVMMIEQYIKGREIQVVVMDNKALGIMEVVPKGLFYDYNAKYNPNSGTKYILDPKIDEKTKKDLLDTALKAYRAMNCRAINRVEFILDDNNQCYFLEANTQPGLTPTSIVPKIAKHYHNIEFNDIIEYLVSSATFDK